MNFIKTEIDGVIAIEPKIFNDPRGFFYESYRKKLFAEHGIKDDFVQDNISSSARGVLRGLHYQIAPRAQAKLMRVLRGSVYDVVVDIRPRSGTFGKFVAMTLSAENKKMLYVPKGFAHGFCVLEDGTEFLYKVSDYYSPEHERGILWNDPALAIPWPKLDHPFILSEKDKKYPTLQSAKAD
ncbi:MAG TPA: dTDP-4-dehydrorhamnose 3,5-epimerase [Candidatus Omnitrophota bacterium]|nr:dTDP-4-dehydrorhamnose 3,5-epimerase [Candidatus Omnitrophota bacterium]HRY86197.1 dTDP-4-dehydrorhamnose 3,5-epimerase [Candidatus Omnitrophota bacterium]